MQKIQITKHKIPGIYALIDPTTFEIRYIGKSARSWLKRSHNHLKPSTIKIYYYRPLYKWILKLSKQNLKPIIKCLAEGTELDNNKLNELEIKYISEFKKNRLLNCTIGGEGTVGYTFISPKRFKIIDSNGIIYNGIGEAAKETGSSHANIWRVLTGGQRQSKGLTFNLLKNGTPKSPNRTSAKNRGVYDSNGNFFKNAKEAALNHKVSRSAVTMCCNSAIPSVGGIAFSYQKDFTLNRKVLPKKKEPIVDNFGQTYESQAYAAKTLGISKNGINRVIHGKQSSVGGFTFKYLDTRGGA